MIVIFTRYLSNSVGWSGYNSVNKAFLASYELGAGFFWMPFLTGLFAESSNSSKNSPLRPRPLLPDLLLLAPFRLVRFESLSDRFLNESDDFDLPCRLRLLLTLSHVLHPLWLLLFLCRSFPCLDDGPLRRLQRAFSTCWAFDVDRLAFGLPFRLLMDLEYTRLLGLFVIIGSTAWLNSPFSVFKWGFSFPIAWISSVISWNLMENKKF